MVQVLIVAKTKMKTGICLGGLVAGSYRSIRPLPAQGYNHPQNKRIRVGEIWDLTLKEMPKREIAPPHTEDVRIIQEQYLRTVPASKLKAVLLKRVRAPFVHPSALFDGLIQFTYKQRGYVSRSAGLRYSTGFWRFDQPLHKYETGGAARYFYLDHLDDGTEVLVLDVKHIGFDEPLETIPPGTLLRFSLSRGYLDNPDKCYLQLSGWFGSYQYSPRAIAIPHTSL